MLSEAQKRKRKLRIRRNLECCVRNGLRWPGIAAEGLRRFMDYGDQYDKEEVAVMANFDAHKAICEESAGTFAGTEADLEVAWWLSTWVPQLVTKLISVRGCP